MNFIDLAGQKFNRWAVIHRVDNIKGRSAWLCRCDCGTERVMEGSYIRRGISKSCGCYRKELSQAIYTKDLTGRRFGSLFVIKMAEERRGSRVAWVCKCDCGKEKVISAHMLSSRLFKECNCERTNMPEGYASLNRLYINYKHNSLNRGYSFDLSKEEFIKLTKGNCFYCGVKPSQITKGKHNNGVYIYNGIDRVDSSKGYTIGNVVPCCKKCNECKKAMSQRDFALWIERVYNHFVRGDHE